MHFSTLAPNMIVKIPVTRAGSPGDRGSDLPRRQHQRDRLASTLPQCIAVAEAVERGLRRRESEGKDIAPMGPVCTIMVGRLDDWLKVRDGEGNPSAQIRATWNGPALLFSRRRTRFSKSAATASACCRRHSAITCTGASSLAETWSSLLRAHGRSGTTPRTSL